MPTFRYNDSMLSPALYLDILHCSVIPGASQCMTQVAWIIVTERGTYECCVLDEKTSGTGVASSGARKGSLTRAANASPTVWHLTLYLDLPPIAFVFIDCR
jgi:hypothetical protein